MTAPGQQNEDRDAQRVLVPPLGWPMRWRMVTITPAARHPLLVLNRYPRQVIGFVVRLPDADSGAVRHRALSIMWAKPARWWQKSGAPILPVDGAEVREEWGVRNTVVGDDPDPQTQEAALDRFELLRANYEHTRPTIVHRTVTVTTGPWRVLTNGEALELGIIDELPEDRP